MARECSENEEAGQKNVVAAPTKEDEPKVQEAENMIETRKALMLKKVLLK